MTNKSPVKKAYVEVPYTEDEAIELLRCEQDPIYFIENYCKVIAPSGDEILFKLYPYQRELINAIHNNQYVAALMSRQSGKTETAVAYMLWYAMFIKNRNILMVAHKYDHVAEIMKRIKQVYELLPFWLKAGVLNDGYNAKSIKFENGSVIMGDTTTETSGRGKSVHLMYIDEFAFVPPRIAKAFWASIKPTLSSTNGKCLITSTPNSDDDEFAQIWHGAINTLDEHGHERANGLGRNGFKAVFASWKDHPKRDQAWADAEYAAIGDERFRREYCNEFISFDETLINPIFINEKFNDMAREPIFSTGSVRWYEPIKPHMKYVVTLDPSMGTGGDNAAMQIIELPTFKQVGEWYHNKTPIPQQVRLMKNILDFIDESMRISGATGEPEIYWTVENNSIGEAALNIIDEIGEDEFKGLFLTERKSHNRSRMYRKGFNTTNKKKLEAAAKMKDMIESGKLKLVSKALIRELKFFVTKGSSYAAKAGERDDLVMSLMLAVRVIQELMAWDDDVMDAMIDNEVNYDDDFDMPMPTIVL